MRLHNLFYQFENKLVNIINKISPKFVWHYGNALLKLIRMMNCYIYQNEKYLQFLHIFLLVKIYMPKYNRYSLVLEEH